jgi:hypothetical protein
MDCSVLLGRQLDALKELTSTLQRGRGDTTTDQIAYRELRDRAAAHFQVREQIVLPALQRGRWKGVNNEALAAHMELKRAVAALCVSEPDAAEFPSLLRHFAAALAEQQQADRRWIIPALRRLTSEAERRRLCTEIERLYTSLIPPAEHYLETMTHQRPGNALVEDATVVLGSLHKATKDAIKRAAQGALE